MYDIYQYLFLTGDFIWRFRGGCWGDAGEAEGRCRRWRLAAGCSNNGDEGELGVDGGNLGDDCDFGR